MSGALTCMDQCHDAPMNWRVDADTVPHLQDGEVRVFHDVPSFGQTASVLQVTSLSSAAGLVCVPEDNLEAAVDDRERRKADGLRKTLTARLAAHATGANRCCVMNCGLVETTGETVRSNEALKRPAVVFKRHHTSSKLLASQAAAFCAPSKSWPRDLCSSRVVSCAQPCSGREWSRERQPWARPE